MTTTIVRLVAPLLLATSLVSNAALAQQHESDFTDVAARYRASHGLDAAPADETAVQAALDKGFAALDVGIFEVRYPWASLADPKRVDEFKQIVLALVDLQVHWI